MGRGKEKSEIKKGVCEDGDSGEVGGDRERERKKKK